MDNRGVFEVPPFITDAATTTVDTVGFSNAQGYYLQHDSINDRVVMFFTDAAVSGESYIVVYDESLGTFTSLSLTPIGTPTNRGGLIVFLKDGGGTTNNKAFMTGKDYVYVVSLTALTIDHAFNTTNDAMLDLCETNDYIVYYLVSTSQVHTWNKTSGTWNPTASASVPVGYTQERGMATITAQDYVMSVIEKTADNSLAAYTLTPMVALA